MRIVKFISILISCFSYCTSMELERDSSTPSYFQSPFTFRESHTGPFVYGGPRQEYHLNYRTPEKGYEIVLYSNNNELIFCFLYKPYTNDLYKLLKNNLPGNHLNSYQVHIDQTRRKIAFAKNFLFRNNIPIGTPIKNISEIEISLLFLFRHHFIDLECFDYLNTKISLKTSVAYNTCIGMQILGNEDPNFCKILFEKAQKILNSNYNDASKSIFMEILVYSYLSREQKHSLTDFKIKLFHALHNTPIGIQELPPFSLPQIIHENHSFPNNYPYQNQSLPHMEDAESNFDLLFYNKKIQETRELLGITKDCHDPLPFDEKVKELCDFLHPHATVEEWLKYNVAWEILSENGILPKN